MMKKVAQIAFSMLGRNQGCTVAFGAVGGGSYGSATAGNISCPLADFVVMPMKREALMPVRSEEVEWSAVRAQGAGGQNVNKVATAIHLRFDVVNSSLPEDVKSRLLALGDQRISKEGVIVIKAQTARTQEQNRAAALARLQALVDSVARPPKPRRPTKPTRASQLRRVDEKIQRGRIKSLRSKPID
jgi:ribosome-associated protein